MVTHDARPDFAARLNHALDRAGVPPKSRGRQSAVGKMFGVSQKGARKWLEGEAMPDTRRLPGIAQTLGISAEWLLTGANDSQQAACTISEEEMQHLRRLRCLPPADRARVLHVLDIVAGGQRTDESA
jgi:transcriptional regulator with XRE-family HTH domain